jgi:hypothetical protein
MKRTALKLIVLFILLLSFFTARSFGQNFTVTPLIEMPGDNIEFDVYSPSDGFRDNDYAYICWINVRDPIYTVFFKQISPVMEEPIVVASDSCYMTRPKIASDGQIVKIAWQRYLAGHWQVRVRTYSDSQLQESFIVLDSLSSNPQIDLNNYRIVWIENGKLYLKDIFPEIKETVLIDQPDCSNPSILKEDYRDFTQIIYEKGNSEYKAIYGADFLKDTNPKVTYSVLSDKETNRNPRFGLGYTISFETLDEQIWKIIYSEYGFEYLTSTANSNCNFNHPFGFNYPVPTGTNDRYTPFFIAFDSDSTEADRDIFIKTFYYGMEDSLINISNCPGDDVEPQISYLSANDTIHIGIFWKHIEDGETNIWMATSMFKPIVGQIERNSGGLADFMLYQNYPNPFNAVTTIRYTIATPGKVELNIYNLLGQKVATLVNESKPSGNYTLTWDASGFSSGIYYCVLRAGGNVVQTRKMVLLK